jgi:hypothetical protein
MRNALSRPPHPDPRASSLDWLSYFTLNTLEPPLPWKDASRLSPAERALVARSIQQFQLGENSEGRGLLRRAREFGARTGDAHFPEAVALFIQEEQRHSRMLGRFLDLNSVPCLARHWVDSVFRRIRALAGLELCMRVLATAEIIAVPYYTALGKATSSPLLAAICTNILADEAAHLAFQEFFFALVAQGRAGWRQQAVHALHSLFLRGTAMLVWLQHGSVLRAAHGSFRAWSAQCLEQFRAVVCPARERGISAAQYPRIQPTTSK